MVILFISFLEWVSTIIIAGGTKRLVEVMIGDLGCKRWKPMPERIYHPSMVMHNGTILMCRGDTKKCHQLNSDGVWIEHSTLNKERYWLPVVATPTATFAFGGDSSSLLTYEYLPKNSNTWHMGKTRIPGNGLLLGSAVAGKSGQEIWLIGGSGNEKRILKFNVNDYTFHEMTTKLNVDRYGLKCCFIPNTNKIMITGGYTFSEGTWLDSTEILDIENGSVTMGSPMNSRRSGHGIGVVTINGKDRLAVFGGYNGRKNLDSVELYNTQTEKWEISDFKLSEAKSAFSFLTVKLGDVIPNL